MNEFRIQHECEFRVSELEIKAAELAERYHRETEAYDRTVCTGPIRDGSIVPINQSQFVLVNRNAHKVRKQIMCEAKQYGIDPQDMARAISTFRFRA
jgi:hypothetical protein